MWRPSIIEPVGQGYVAIADAIATDVRAGRLAPGDRLPAQRALARDLGVNPTTVSRAYALAEARGLVVGEVGRGTYVRSLPASGRVPWPRAQQAGVVDLSSNFPAPVAGAEALRAALADLQRDEAARRLMQYQPDGVLPAHQTAAAQWLARHGLDLPPDRLLLTCGAIHAGFLCLQALTRPGDRILVEELTSPAVIGAANVLGLRVAGLPMDADGVTVEGLDRALLAEPAKAIYLIPNLQNPTLAILPEVRRREIARLAARHGAMVIEGDAYGPLLQDGPPPIATLAPQLTCYVTSLSKVLAPGLRVGFLVAPLALRAKLLDTLRVSLFMTPPLLGHIAAHWITSGIADKLLAELRAEAGERQTMAARALAGFEPRGHPAALHVWLRLPQPWRAADFAAHLREAGTAVLPSENFAAVDGYAPDAVRVSLCNVETRDELATGLAAIQALLSGRG